MSDSVHLTDSAKVLAGLSDMIEAALGPHDYTHSFVDVPIALFILELVRRAPDKPEWFPRGKWATIQSIQTATEKELVKLKWESGK